MFPIEAPLGVDTQFAKILVACDTLLQYLGDDKIAPSRSPFCKVADNFAVGETERRQKIRQRKKTKCRTHK